MKTRSLWLSVLITILICIFVYGTLRLLRLRYEAGDVYPPYSSLRSDPLGAKALYESLDRLDKVSCSRNYSPFTELKELRDTTIFYQGLAARQFLHAADKEAVEAVEEIVSQGGRFFLSFLPVSREGQLTAPWSFDFTEEERSEQTAKKEEHEEEAAEKEPRQEDTGENQEEPFSLSERWGLELRVGEAQDREGDIVLSARPASSQHELPAESLSWHTALYFGLQDDAWRLIYRQGKHPALIERRLGKGSIIISADSYFLSNEALRVERHPELLTWLVGRNPNVLFDETHFGMRQSEGVATLIRRHQLEGFFIALFVLALLFIWKNVTSLVPKREEAALETKSAEKDMMAGLVNLLRSNISSRELLSVCFQEWETSFAPLRNSDPETFEKIGKIVQAEKTRPARERNPVKAYQNICRFLSKSPRLTGWRPEQK